jgi:hypothetical protein
MVTGFVCASLIRPPPTMAQETPGPADEDVPAAASAPVRASATFTGYPRRQPAVTVLTDDQFDRFVDIVGAPAQLVQNRLDMDPALVPVAAEAAEKQRHRQRSGARMMATGFTIVLVGAIIGTVLAVPPPTDESRSSSLSYSKGDAIFMASAAALGFLIAIPGLFKMVTRSDLERRAAAAYWAQ